MHGGGSPQVRKKANERLARQTALQVAQKELDKAGNVTKTPLEHLEAVLAEDARTYAIWTLACESLQAEGNELTIQNRHGELMSHPYLEERNKAATRWARTSKYALDAGVSAKRVAIEQQKAEMMAAALRATFTVLTREFDLPLGLPERGLAVLGGELRRLNAG
jgi:hypothetical protein